MSLWNFLDSWLSYSIRRQLLDRDLETFCDQMHGRVLEIGCGRKGRRGHFSPPVSDVQMWIYLDLRLAVLPHLCADIEQLPFTSQVFDTLVCLEVMEYTSHPAKALSEMYHILKPGGTLILAMPFLHRADTQQDYWRFTEYALRHLLAEAGFEVQQIKAQGAALAVAVNILKYIIYAIQRPVWRNLIAFVAYLPLIVLFLLDEPVAQRLPVLRTFSTGFLVWAKRLY